MVRKAAVSAAALLALAACAPISSTHGFQALDVKPAELKVGEDTKSTVLERLGSPSVVSTFDPNLWFYMSQSVEQIAFYKPRVTNRDVVAVSFDEGEKVQEINTFKLADGRVIAFNGRETPTRGRELTILEQLIGNVGRAGNILGRPEDRDGPGGRRRE
jgi:outer membrane protein assembly factor BamE (lipoprotein component of BamABCDE complex)